MTSDTHTLSSRGLLCNAGAGAAAGMLFCFVFFNCIDRFIYLLLFMKRSYAFCFLSLYVGVVVFSQFVLSVWSTCPEDLSHYIQ